MVFSGRGFQAEIVVQGSRRVISELIASVLRQREWPFHQAGGTRDLEIGLGKEFHVKPYKLDGGISLISLAGRRTIIQFYTGPKSLAEMMMSDQGYNPDASFISQVYDAVVQRLTQLGLFKAPKSR